MTSKEIYEYVSRLFPAPSTDKCPFPRPAVLVDLLTKISNEHDTLTEQVIKGIQDKYTLVSHLEWEQVKQDITDLRQGLEDARNRPNSSRRATANN